MSFIVDCMLSNVFGNTFSTISVTENCGSYCFRAGQYEKKQFSFKRPGLWIFSRIQRINRHSVNSSYSLPVILASFKFFCKLSVHWRFSLATSHAWIFRQSLLTPQWMEVHRFNRLWTLNVCQTSWKLQSWTFNSGKNEVVQCYWIN